MNEEYEKISRVIELIDSVKDAPVDLLRIDGIYELIHSELKGVSATDITEYMRKMGMNEKIISNNLIQMGCSYGSVVE